MLGRICFLARKQKAAAMRELYFETATSDLLLLPLDTSAFAYPSKYELVGLPSCGDASYTLGKRVGTSLKRYFLRLPCLPVFPTLAVAAQLGHQGSRL